MADVTLQHPVTGIQRTVSHQKAESLVKAGWLETFRSSRASRGPGIDPAETTDPELNPVPSETSASETQPAAKSTKKKAQSKEAPDAQEENS